jgi:hypothetical protein
LAVLQDDPEFVKLVAGDQKTIATN